MSSYFYTKMNESLESETKTLFNKASAYVASGSFDVSVSDRLYFYSRYKQATEGPCSAPKPSVFDLQGRKKWEAWNSIKGLSKDEAERQYIAKLNELDPTWEDSAPIKTGWVSVSTMMKEPPLDPSEKDVFDFVKEDDLATLKTMPLEAIRARDQNGMTTLHWASDRGYREMVRYLLSVLPDANEQDHDGQTALHYAASCGHESVVKLLLEHGANVTLRDCEGLSPFDCAEEEKIKALLSS